MLKAIVAVLCIGMLFVLIQYFHFDTTPNNTLRNNIQLDQSSSVGVENEYHVTRVVDGDTFIVQNGSRTERVRIIGINTPESVDPRRQVECLGVEASKELKQKIENQKVILTEDATQQSVDRYGRWLRHVFLGKENVGKYMIQQGLAYEYTYAAPYVYRDEYKKAQLEAQLENRGLWSPQACK